MISKVGFSKNESVGLLVFKGISSLTIRELRMYGVKTEALDNIKLRNHELLIFELTDVSQNLLCKLRTVEDIFYIPFMRLSVRKIKDLKAIAKYWSSKQFSAGLTFKNKLSMSSRKSGKTYAVFVKADSNRQVKRKEIASELARVPASFSRWKAADPASVEVWCFYSQEKLTVGIRLTDNDFRHRKELLRTRRAALRPTIAAAIAVASEPNDDDSIIDPMCGVGTILYERGKIAGFTRMFGSDIDPDAIEYARLNVERKFAGRASVGVCDARYLSLPEKSIDVILCNLPFGKAFSDRNQNLKLYSELAPSFLRVLKKSGRMVLLTSDIKSLIQTFGRYTNLQIEVVTRANVLGIWASIVFCSLKVQ